MKKLFAVTMILLLVLNSIVPAMYPTVQEASAHAPPPPPMSTPTSTPPPGQGAPTQDVHVPPSPNNLSPEVEQARARQAIEVVLEKYLRYWGSRYQVVPVEVTVEGEWAQGIAHWQSQARTLKEPIHILAHRLPDGFWQALMPSADGLYLRWVDVVPESLVPAGEKSQLRTQAAEADALQRPQATPAVPPAATAMMPGKEGPGGPVEPVQGQVQPTATPTPISLFPEAQNAFQAALDTYTQLIAPGKSFRLTEIRSDGIWAYAVAQEVDSQGREVPYQFFVLLGRYEFGQGWRVVIPRLYAAEEYNAFLVTFPDRVIDESTKAYLHQPESRISLLANFSGHKLPWPAGQIGYVTKKGGSNHENQVDFDILGSGTSGDVYASKPGTVVFVKESSNNGCCDFSCWEKANMVVVKHSDGEYSWYVHLAHNSVPVSVGDQVGFGTKIGVEGNTGYACGVHLHYMASTGHTGWTDPNDPNKAPWATGITAVDFAEVSWAGLTVGQGYISQNSGGGTCDATSIPSGYTKCADEGGRCNFSGTKQVYYGANSCFKVKSFSNGVDCNNNNFGDPVPGTQKACYVEPDSPPPSCNPNADQIALFVDANYSGQCVVKGIGQYSNPGAIGLPNDSISSLKVGSNVKAILCRDDNYGGGCEEFTGDDSNLGDNSIGNDQVSSVKVESRTAACNPNADQIALFVDANYSGQCVVKGIGQYPNPGAIGLPNDSISSIKVGGNVKAILCRDDNYSGTCETFTSDDPHLGNNSIGNDQVSSVKVEQRAQPPSAPSLQSPANGSTFNEGNSITLSWSTTGDQYYGEVWDGPGGTLTFGWQNETLKNIGSQWAGYTYSWHVKARNSVGESGWSSTWTFTVRPAAPSNLDAQTASCSQINLYWNDNSGNEEGYKVYRNGFYIGQVGMNTTSYKDTGRNENTTYSYYVKAFRGSIESNASNTVNITTPPCAPPQPDLVPAQWGDWQYPIVPSSITGTTVVNTLYANYPTYIDWGVSNIGNADCGGDAYGDLYIDDTRLAHYNFGNILAGWSWAFFDWMETVNTPGWHTLKVIADPDDLIAESDETNNVWQRDFYWTPSVPYADDVESGTYDWTATGLWHQVDEYTSPYPESHSWSHSWWYGQDATGDYDTGAANSGDLTSPPLYIPSTGHYLRFWYWYETETQGQNWDQRWVQISVDGGPFNNVLQLFDDPMNWWLQSPAIDLSGYAGHVIQVNFHFDTIDDAFNDYRGWYIDDFDISTTSPPSCADSHEPNNNSAQTTTIAYGQTLSGDICPGGDYDFYTFTGTAGDKVVVDIDAKVNGSSLDSYIFLLDSDGTSVLAEHDDEITYEVQDSHLGYHLPHDGTYYIKVKAWNHPSVGGTDYFYTVHLLTDDVSPSSAEITSPDNDAWLDPSLETINVSASDNESGINRVEFLWHDADWENSEWVWLGADQDGRNGWRWDFDTSSLAEQRSGAFYTWAFDWAGNWTGAGVWNLGIDRTPPIATAYVGPMYGDAPFRDFHVWWYGSDNLSSVASYDVQYRDGSGGTWTNLLTETTDTYYRFAGQDGHTYYFRARARDNAGNQGPYAGGDGDAQHTVEICPTPPDDYEMDSTASNAKWITTDGTYQTHTIHVEGDQDWVKFHAAADFNYVLATTNTGGHADTVLDLYDTDGNTLIDSNDDYPNIWLSSCLSWQPSVSGIYYAKVDHWDPYAYGCTTAYDLSIWICDVDVADIQRVASRWRTSCADPDPDNNPGTPNYEAWYDIDGDCDIDIVDIMLVVKHWGEVCEPYVWIEGVVEFYEGIEMGCWVIHSDSMYYQPIGVLADEIAQPENESRRIRVFGQFRPDWISLCGAGPLIEVIEYEFLS
jgi:murein DD-endopeptidase MepM/ murein hydrolase activator NlpD